MTNNEWRVNDAVSNEETSACGRRTFTDASSFSLSLSKLPQADGTSRHFVATHFSPLGGEKSALKNYHGMPRVFPKFSVRPGCAKLAHSST